VTNKPSNPEDLANQARAKAWNEFIVPRLQSINGWFLSEDFIHGVAPYLRAAKAELVNLWVRGDSPLTADQQRYLAGCIASWQEFLAMPEAIFNSIAAADRNKSEAEKRKEFGKAGYG
jgi:hypothetical protein